MTEILSELSPEDAFRFEIITKTLSDSTWTVERAAEVLHLTTRQVFRLKAKVQDSGPAGVIHGSRGHRPINAKPLALRERVVRVYERDFAGEGWNYDAFTEALAEHHDIHLSRETVRNWLREAGQGHKVKRYRHHRHHRERRARMGQMLFLDGSPHRWFGPDSPRMTLILATDEATGQPLHGRFKPQEWGMHLTDVGVSCGGILECWSGSPALLCQSMTPAPECGRSAAALQINLTE